MEWIDIKRLMPARPGFYIAQVWYSSDKDEGDYAIGFYFCEKGEWDVMQVKGYKAEVQAWMYPPEPYRGGKA